MMEQQKPVALLPQQPKDAEAIVEQQQPQQHPPSGATNAAAAPAAAAPGGGNTNMSTVKFSQQLMEQKEREVQE